MFENKMFIKVMNDIGITINDEIIEGKFSKLVIKKESMTISMTLSFPNVLSVDTVVFLRRKLTDFFVSDNMYKKINIEFKYDDNSIDDDQLLRYFEYILSVFESKKTRYSIIKLVNKAAINGTVKLFVANEEEIYTLSPMIEEINKIFKLYGLKSNVVAEVSNFEVPIQALIDERIEMEDKKVMRQQANYDNIGKVEEPTKQKVQKQPKMKNKLNGKVSDIKDIPATEIQLIEYIQRHEKAEFVILGDLVSTEIKTIKSSKSGTEKTYKIFNAVVSDNSDSIVVSTFMNLENPQSVDFYEKKAVAGKKIRAYGYAEYNKFQKDVILKVVEMQIEGDVEKKEFTDQSDEKRVELHAHTKMSTQDGVMDVDAYVKVAKEFGFNALAITDHYNIHAWPDFEKACKSNGIKPIYGVEGALISEENYKIALTDADINLQDATYCVYDIETTGLSSNFDEIIEIGACKIKNGVIIDEFSSFVKPSVPISAFTTSLTSITQDDVRNADTIDVVLPKFKEFFDGCILVAHNATFDNSHIYANLKKLNLYEKPIPTIDTLQLFRLKYGKNLKKFGLDAMVKFFDIVLVQHHRAVHDAKATALCFIAMLNGLADSNIINYNQINTLIDENEAFKYGRPDHITLLSLNEVGKKNIYKIVSDSHTVHFYNKDARIIKSFLQEHREGILVGSACVNGEIFELAHKKSYEELVEAMKFYDFIEIQPLELYEVLQEGKDLATTKYEIKETVMKIIKVAQELNKMIVATGDVHHLTKQDKIYREVYISAPMVGGGVHPLVKCKNIPSFHFRNTMEMLKDFSFLDEDLAYEIVVTNTNKIADMVESYNLFPKELFSPQDDFLADRGVPSISQATIDMTYKKAKELYGEDLPQYIKDRLEKELNSIIGNKFAPIYYIAYMLVDYSKKAGYVVGSRGSVGSSLVAYMMDITEVNGLPPHYYCPKCKFTALKLSQTEKESYPLNSHQKSLDEVLQSVGTGFDLPIMKCPVCGEILNQNGVDIPFETFLGFEGDKVPDIDLNFSGDFQTQAHEFCRTVFGVDRAFRAGTIGTIAEKKAYGYVKGYFERKNIVARGTEIARLSKEIEGVKQSTGQHPGGIVVIPQNIHYYDIVPIQYPADDTSAKWRTTHFDYHKFESNLLKLDILGHDDPTMIRHLMNFVEEFPEEFPFKDVDGIPLNDREVFKLFSGLESLKLEPSQTFGQTIGTTGLPEFGTSLTKDMLKDIRPQTVDELLKISGLSHGTDVWAGNAKDFMLGVKKGYPKIPFPELIGCRDDIMVYLMSKNIPPRDAFNIMEKVRKGKGVSKEYEQLMKDYNVPDWYIESCKLIKYMFPKAHATAYVIMALRIGWFKVYRPIYYYSGFFSRRASAFDVEAMASGFEAIKAKLVELDIKIKNHTASAKEEDTFAALLLAIEMVARGMKFKQMNINDSEAINFKVLDDKKSLLIPFGALDSLGPSIAYSIVEARNEHPFTSKQDVLKRTKLNATQFERMNAMGVFDGLPDDDQIGLF